MCFLSACAASFPGPDGGDEAGAGDAVAGGQEVGVVDMAARGDARPNPDARGPAADVGPDPDAARSPAEGAYASCSREVPCRPEMFCIAFDRGPGAYCAPVCDDVCPDHEGPGPAECSTFGGRRVCVARCDLARVNTTEGCPADLVCRDVGDALGLCAPG